MKNAMQLKAIMKKLAKVICTQFSGHRLKIE